MQLKSRFARVLYLVESRHVNFMYRCRETTFLSSGSAAALFCYLSTLALSLLALETRPEYQRPASISYLLATSFRALFRNGSVHLASRYFLGFDAPAVPASHCNIQQKRSDVTTWDACPCTYALRKHRG
ncbi:hypothetical protein MRX96_004030 [Rhipicephalus microplus]